MEQVLPFPLVVWIAEVQNLGPDLALPLLRKERCKWSDCNVDTGLIYMAGIASSTHNEFSKNRKG